MLVQALARYADTYLQKELSDLAFEEKLVPLTVEIDQNGRSLSVVERTEQKVLGKRTFTVSKKMLVPKSPVNRNSGVHPLLACDAIQYVVGCDPAWTGAGEREKHARHHEAFIALINVAAEKTKDPALRACAKFYASPAEVAKARKELAAKKPNGGANVALVVRPAGLDSDETGGPVVARPEVRRYWKEHYDKRFAERNAEGGEAMCLISGKVGPVAVTHDKIKGTSKLGGQPAGVALMSFDKEAFRSYGWKQNANSPVSPERAAAYVLALNDLLVPGKHRAGRSRDKVLRTRSDYGGVAFLYWTREPEDTVPVDSIENPGPDEIADPDEIARLFEAPRAGNEGAAAVVDDNAFYLLAVSGNGGRLTVRDWSYASLKCVDDNVKAWFDGLRIADVFNGGASSKPPKLWELLAAIAGAHTKPDDSLNAERSMALMRRALQGQLLPLSVLAAALGRLRVAQGRERFNPARMGLIRLCTNDLISSKGGKTVSASVDEGEAHPAYICGRLLAVYEELQYAAQGETNVSVVDRYYPLAASSPQLAFPKLETLSHAHLKKLRRENRGASVAIERKLHDLSDVLSQHGATYPAQLNLEDQGRFALGFHHQKALAQARMQAAREKKAQPAVPTDAH